jgi:hypothetical protein
MVSSTTWRQAGGGRTPGPACSARRQSPKLPAVGCPCTRHSSCFPFCSSVLCFDSATRAVGSLALAAVGMNHERDGVPSLVLIFWSHLPKCHLRAINLPIMQMLQKKVFR